MTAICKFTVHGARGSSPVSKKETVRYGGNTSCFSLMTDEGVILFDVGTGASGIGNALSAAGPIPPITILLTHSHLDHIQGLPAFKPLLDPKVRMTLMGDPENPDGFEQVKAFCGKPFWPVELEEFPATVNWKNLPEKGEDPLPLYGVTIQWCRNWHPQGSLSFKIQTPEGTIVLATDRECGDPSIDKSFLSFCQGADLLIHDAQYLPQEYPSRKGWGHSTWEQAAAIAVQAQVSQLVLTSHDPDREDAQIDQICKEAQKIFPNTTAAQQDSVLSISSGSV